MSTTETPVEQLKAMLRQLFGNEQEMKDMEADPESYFSNKGLSDITPADVDSCVAEMAPSYAASGHYAAVAQAAAPAAAGSAAAAAAAQVVTHQQTIVQQYGDFTYIDESSESYVDNSVEVGDVLNVGGEVDLDIDQDNVTATEGGVAAGEDIDGNVNTGEVNGVQGDGNTVDDMVFGDGNTLTEDNDNTVFANNGDATNVDGDGNDLTQIDVTGSEDTNIALGDGNYQSADDIDNSINDSFNTDNSVDNSINDSFDTEDSFNQTDNSINDSFNETDNSVDVQTDVETDVGLF
jgi:hypothetical protein